ncbi:39S ribosomal protein L46, mitochondrial [Varanus komodoensis]|uniref:Large ribosomal subunit protein mL46 n=1 Tax=Varanus komodoensis TaxID=61221 RepID=A0A8D2LW34_VARKO|nr:39S ribosomal protein L46, mitochondrial [Varanus komodoensis]KAF7241595.1 39S ribosomal protein L46, mitochondrial [Varanus komodoensis]
MAASVGRSSIGAALRIRSAGPFRGCWRGLCISAAAVPKWRLLGALCLQRPPRLTQAMSSEEEEMAELLRQIEIEKSLYSDHELHCLAEEERLQRRKDNYDDDDDSGKEIVLTQDLEEKWEQNFQMFTPAPRITDADKSNDQTSLNRKLDQNLLLLVKEKICDQDIWLLPQTEWKDGETLRATAERTLVTLSGTNAEASFLGNAPCGFYKYKLPRAARTEGTIGVKVFFFKALLKSNRLPLLRDKDYVWVSKGELGDYLKPEYHSQVARFLMDL